MQIDQANDPGWVKIALGALSAGALGLLAKGWRAWVITRRKDRQDQVDEQRQDRMLPIRLLQQQVDDLKTEIAEMRVRMDAREAAWDAKENAYQKEIRELNQSLISEQHARKNAEQREITLKAVVESQAVEIRELRQRVERIELKNGH